MRLRKKPKIRRWFLYLVLALFLLAVLLSVLLYLIFYSSLFRISELEIPLEIKNDLTAGLMADSFVKRWLGPANFLFWSEKDIEKSRDFFPFIKSFELEKSWSDRRVVLKIEKRNRAGVYCLVQKKECFWFDKEGIVFESAPSVSGFLITRIDDENQRSLAPGNYILEEQEFTRTLLELINVLSQTDAFETEKFVIRDLNLKEIKVITKTAELYFSLRAVPKDISGIISRLENELRGFKELNYIDFRVENRIYYK